MAWLCAEPEGPNGAERRGCARWALLLENLWFVLGIEGRQYAVYAGKVNHADTFVVD